MADLRRAALAALALVPASAALAFARQAQPAGDSTAAVVTALREVCRPSTEQNVPPEVSATRLRYPSVDTPPNLPTGRPLHAWQAPGPSPGKIYLLEGGLPASAQAGCILAVYGEPLPLLPGAVQAALAKDGAGFARNPTVDVAGPRQLIARFDRRKGRVVTTITVLQPTAPGPDAPTAMIVVSRVDYGWMDKF